MALQLVLSRDYEESWSTTTRFNISRISSSDEWSTINLYPHEFSKKINAKSVACSGNGLLCFYCGELFEKDSEFVIWNLSTDTYQLIPPPDSRYLPCFCSSKRCVKSVINRLGSGLGFVAESHDYKFVRFLCIYNSLPGEIPHYASHHVAVYSSKNNSWKELPFPFGFDDEYDISPRAAHNRVATCVNGFLYWTSTVDVILSFDLSSDNFSTLPYPDDDDIPRDFSLDNDVFLFELDGSLGLMIQSKLEKMVRGTANRFIFWVYKCQGASSSSSSPWTRKGDLDVHFDKGSDGMKPLWLGKKNNGGEYSLLLEGYGGALVEYDYTRRVLKKIDQIHDQYRSSMIISPFVETNIAKCVNDDGDGVDRISQLPDHIIHSILSYLSLKEVASTSVLSTRWSDLWKHTPNLNFHDIDHLLSRDKHKYIECVNSVVESHKAPSLKEFNISFPLKYSTRRTVTKWLEFAFSRRVEALELNLFGTRFAFLAKFLRKLKSTNLRSLCLKCLEVSGEAIGLLLRNCPLLERLIIKYAVLTSDIEVSGGALKHLDIQYCIGGISIKGYAPNLTYLKIDSGPCPYTLVNVDHVYPKLVWATQQSADHPPVFRFISSQLTTLEFTLHCPKGFLEKGFPQMPSLRELIVTYHKCGHSIRPITSLICALPYLEEFEIKHYRRSCVEQQGMEAVNNVERFCHRHLRVFKFTWFDVSDGDHIELLSYILENCVALEKIILDIYDADSPSTSPSYVAAMECAKQLQSKLPTHIQLIMRFNYRQLV